MERIEYCYRSQELLRLLHNVFSKWLHDGLTEVQYDQLPAKVRNKYPYKAKLTAEDWDKFRTEDFEARSNKIGTEIVKQKDLLKQSVRWDIKIEDV
jgi:hypothetical protein